MEQQEIIKQKLNVWGSISPYFVGDEYAKRGSTSNETNTGTFAPEGGKDIHIGVDGISVKLLYMTDLKQFAEPLAYMVNATVGGEPPKEKIDAIAKEIFKGGLQQALEHITMIFEISGVSRAFTHQVVRHRKWSFHQQSMRFLNPGALGIRISPNIAGSEALFAAVKKHWQDTKELYQKLHDSDIPLQDCRDVLPIGTQTYIIAECSLKEFAATFAYRGCSLFQQQMVYVMWRMREEVLKRYPELESYIQLGCLGSKRCMYQGWETAKQSCSLPFAGDKKFVSEVYK